MHGYKQSKWSTSVLDPVPVFIRVTDGTQNDNAVRK